MSDCEHDYTAWNIVEEGDYKIRQCTLCGDVDIEPIEAEDLGFESIEDEPPDYPDEPIQKNMYVWYGDIGYSVLEIKNGIAHIEELDASVMGRNYIPGVDDLWVHVEKLTPFSETDYEECE